MYGNINVNVEKWLLSLMSFITLISASVVRFVMFKDLIRVSCFRVVIDHIEDNDCLSVSVLYWKLTQSLSKSYPGGYRLA